MEFFTEGKITLLEEKLGSKRVSEILSSVKAFSAARRDLHLENLITNPVCPIDEFLQQFPSKKLALYIHGEYLRAFLDDRLIERKSTLKIFTQSGHT